jgi:hypothetical protein
MLYDYVIYDYVNNFFLKKTGPYDYRIELMNDPRGKKSQLPWFQLWPNPEFLVLVINKNYILGVCISKEKEDS